MYFCVVIGDKIIYSSPLQGYTDCVWRNAHAAVFGGVDCYCTPFARIERGEVRKRDLVELARQHNHVPELLPQILAGNIDDTITLATKVKEAGYTVIDLNMGCPHPPVALKHKGSGLLKYPDEIAVLVRELRQIPDVKFTVKMRLGWEETTQWKAAIDAIISLNPQHIALHPRTGKQQYKGELHIDDFREFYTAVDCPIVYNGGIGSLEDVSTLFNEYPDLKGVMVGRGLISRPDLFSCNHSADDLMKFHNLLLEGYSKQLTGGEAQILNKMKTQWEYFLPNTDRKLLKAIKKSHNLQQYITVTTTILSK